MMKRSFLLLLSLLFLAAAAEAQTATDSVKATIDKMFRAMRMADSTMFKEAMADSAIMQTIMRDRTGASIIKTENTVEFARFVSTIPKGAADERITYDVIRIDGPLAIVWTPYKFYLNGQFSHCGVNSFQLVRMKDGWKIQYIIDTRRKQPCE